MDEALLDVACASQGEFLRDDSLCEARLRLPSRALGGGLRSHEATAHAAFASTFAKIAPRLVNSVDSHGVRRRGFLDRIACEVLGYRRFDGDTTFEWGGPGRFDTLVDRRYQSRLAFEFV